MVNNKGPLTQERTHDEQWAERAMAKWRASGFHAEFHGMREVGTETWRYYALVLPQAKFDELLNAANERNRSFWESAEILNHNEFEPRDSIPWEDMIAQPTFVAECATRRQALLASGSAYIKQS